jgi:hypothetical protein
MFYEIIYEYNGREFSHIEQPQKGWEGNLLENTLNRIESLTNAGAVIKDLRKVDKK